MKPLSLAWRLAFQVILTGAALVALLILLGYAVLVHQLELRAQEELASKLAQIDHGLLEDTATGMARPWQHALSDTVLGHDDLSITVIDKASNAVIFRIGRFAHATERFARLDKDGYYHAWKSQAGIALLTGRKDIQVPGLPSMILLLSQDRVADQRLVWAFLRSVLLAVPMLLLLIGAAGWLVAHNGLRPLLRFRSLARQVSTQDLSPRIPTEQLPREIQALGHSLNIMLHRLDTGVQQLAQFSDDAAHELRAPLNNLMGKAQVTLSRERSRDEYREALESSVEELERLSRLVSDMLFLAQVSHATQVLDFEALSLGGEARQVCEFFDVIAQDAGVALVVEGDAQVRANRLMIQRVLSNLLSNALRHSRPGGTVQVAIGRGASGAPRLSVSNDGETIPAEHLAHLFERFYRVDGVRPHGSGLGLSIVRSVMSLHEGHVGVTSEAGRTTFELVFAAPE